MSYEAVLTLPYDVGLFAEEYRSGNWHALGENFPPSITTIILLTLLEKEPYKTYHREGCAVVLVLGGVFPREP